LTTLDAQVTDTCEQSESTTLAEQRQHQRLEQRRSDGNALRELYPCRESFRSTFIVPFTS
jgi:hypothetical protein